MNFSPSSFWIRFFRFWLPMWLLVAATTRGADHALFDQVLRDHVRNGEVDYAAVKTDARLAAYLDSLAAPRAKAEASRAEDLVYWINAYNAYTLRLVADHLPLKSIKDIPHPGLKSPWDLPMARADGQLLTLNQIEHEILRKRYDEPRIHYALVCAAVSCPPLRSEAYTVERLEAQLSEQARVFLARMNQFDLAKREARLSSIFNWFAIDFGPDQTALLKSLAPYVSDPELRASLSKDAAAWRVTYLDYDWTLNARR